MSSAWDNDEYVNRLMFKEITSTTPLTKDEEAGLFREYKTASPRRRDTIKATIINANLRFALKSCLLYKNVPNVNIADMMTEAKIGMFSAFDTYDPNGGTKFISWAVWQIRHRFSKYFDGIDMIRIPTHQKTKLSKARKESDPDTFSGDTLFYHTITQPPVSLDMQCNEDDPDCKLHEILVDNKSENPEHSVYRNEVTSQIQSILDSCLTQDESAIIKSIYGINCEEEGLSGASVAVNRSHERTRQIRDKALAKLAKDERIQHCAELMAESRKKI